MHLIEVSKSKYHMQAMQTLVYALSFMHAGAANNGIVQMLHTFNNLLVLSTVHMQLRRQHPQE